MSFGSLSFFGKIAFLLEKFWPSYLAGAGTTLLIAIIGTIVGCMIGFIVGIIQTIPTNPNDSGLKKAVLKVVNVILSVYVEVFRGTPMMVQAVVIYYGAMYINIDMSMWTAAFFIVSINTGAYMSETMRGGIHSIDVGQTEGAKAIGMSHIQTMTNVILPQAIRNIMPQIGNNLIINIKDCSVLSAISVTELFFVGKSVAGGYYAYFESFFIVSCIYLIMTVTCSRILRYTERKMDGKDSYSLHTDTLAYTSGMASYTIKEGE